MLENEEAKELGLEDEGLLANRAGLTFLSHPIPDRHVPPDVANFKSFASELAKRLGEGERVAVHCRGSIGRATITTASTLIELGWNPQAALTAIEAARGCPVPDTNEQRDWILRYEAQL
jgi:protein-tyrosine phosphatase